MQPTYPYAAAPTPAAAPVPAPKKSPVAKIVVGCLLVLVLSCCCFSGLGGYVAYLDNRSLYTLGDEVTRVPLQLGAPQQVRVEFPGSGYAFAQIWADIEAQQTGPELTVTGTVSCERGYGGGGYPGSIDVMVWEQNARVADYARSGEHVTAKIMLHDEYMRAGEGARTCTVTMAAAGGTLTGANLVVRTYQRPSDRFAN